MLNDEIRRLRKASGLNQVSFADKMGVSQSTVASWENGTRRPDLDALCRIADLFNVSLDELLGTPMAHEMTDEERDLWALREEVRRDPERRILFSLARNANIEDVRRAVAIIDALKKTSEGGNDDDPA